MLGPAQWQTSGKPSGKLVANLVANPVANLAFALIPLETAHAQQICKTKTENLPEGIFQYGTRGMLLF